MGPMEQSEGLTAPYSAVTATVSIPRIGTRSRFRVAWVRDIVLVAQTCNCTRKDA